MYHKNLQAISDTYHSAPVSTLLCEQRKTLPRPVLNEGSCDHHSAAAAEKCKEGENQNHSQATPWCSQLGMR